MLQDNECVLDGVFGGVVVSRSFVCRSDVLETKQKIRGSLLCLSRKTKSHSRFISVSKTKIMNFVIFVILFYKHLAVNCNRHMAT